MDWIKNLKPNDKVFICSSSGKSLKSVEAITPAGNIKVDGRLFNKNGSLRGASPWHSCWLEELTEESLTQYIEDSIIKKAIKLMRNTTSINADQAKVIIDVLTIGEPNGVSYN